MTTLHAALAVLLLAACGGAAADPASPEYSNDSLESPAGELDAPEQVAQVEPAPEPEPVVEVAPSTPAPSDAPDPVVEVLPEPEPVPAPSPATRDDEPDPVVEVEPAPSPMEGDDEPEPEPAPVPGWIEGGDPCTDTAQCVDGLTCSPMYDIWIARYVDDYSCLYDPDAEAPLVPTTTPGAAEDGDACNNDGMCASGLCTPTRPRAVQGVCEPMPADGSTHFCQWRLPGCI